MKFVNVYEYLDNADCKWIAAATEAEADSAAARRGWRRARGRIYEKQPLDAAALKQMGVDVIVRTVQ